MIIRIEEMGYIISVSKPFEFWRFYSFGCTYDPIDDLALDKLFSNEDSEFIIEQLNLPKNKISESNAQ